MAINPASLKAEFTTDPSGLGYAAAWSNGTDWQLMDAINLIRGAISITSGIVFGQRIVNVLDPAEFAALTQLQVLQLMLLLSASGGVDLNSGTVRIILASMFPQGGPTRAALVTLATRQGSRAEQLFGAGINVTYVDIAAARKA